MTEEKWLNSYFSTLDKSNTFLHSLESTKSSHTTHESSEKVLLFQFTGWDAHDVAFEGGDWEQKLHFMRRHRRSKK
jgi:hypothetical protein